MKVWLLSIGWLGTKGRVPALPRLPLEQITNMSQNEHLEIKRSTQDIFLAGTGLIVHVRAGDLTPRSA